MKETNQLGLGILIGILISIFVWFFATLSIFGPGGVGNQMVAEKWIEGEKRFLEYDNKIYRCVYDTMVTSMMLETRR